jgi:hypothetical protein
MSAEEIEQVIATAVKVVKGRLPVVPGTGFKLPLAMESIAARRRQGQIAFWFPLLRGRRRWDSSLISRKHRSGDRTFFNRLRPRLGHLYS